jgi:SOS response regulatory protein OraA/RecX
VNRHPTDQSNDSESNKALLKKAAALLAGRSYSRGELRLRLLKTAGEADVESALDRLEQLNLLNDAEYAYNFALYRIGRENWSRAKVVDALRRRQVESEIIDGALRRIHRDLGAETVSVEYMQKYCGKHWPLKNPAHIRKLVMHLRRRGFADGAIESALRKILPEPLFQRFEIGE